jgi:hypothetical protein
MPFGAYQNSSYFPIYDDVIASKPAGGICPLSLYLSLTLKRDIRLGFYLLLN